MTSNVNNDSFVEISSNSSDVLSESYRKYIDLRQENDNLKQKLHQEISQRKVLENTLIDIQGELDSINLINKKENIENEKKNEELRNKNRALVAEKMDLENELMEKYSAIEKFNEEVKELKGFLAVRAIKPRISDTYAKSLEIENSGLRATINDMKEQFEELLVKYTESTNKIEELNQKIQENIESNKNHMLHDDNSEILDYLKEKVDELTEELELYKNSAPVNVDRKGNSLFAEVDDQRQKLKNALLDERKYYKNMEKENALQKIEIRRLKRENLNIKSEIQACTKQLMRGEQLSSNHYKIFISNLEAEKHNLEMQLKKLEKQFVDFAKDQKLHWVESILVASHKENRELKDKNFMLLREKTALADNHNKVLKQFAKTRLDGIKLKVLLGRIVDEFKLKIDPIQYVDLGIDENVFENLKLEEYDAQYLNEDENSIKETIEMSLKQESGTFSDMLDESTIFLLGGREKLGNAVPSVQKARNVDMDGHVKLEEKSFVDEKSCSSKSEVGSKALDDKENVKIVNVQSASKYKIMQSSSTESKSSNNDEQIQQVRKRPMFTVTRIVIPSKTSKNT